MKAAAITLWIAAFAVIVLLSIEGMRLKAVHAQIRILQADESLLEAKLAARLRMGRLISSRRVPAGKPNATPALEPEFALAPPLTWVRTARLTDAGNATPKAAFESVLWAATQANVDALTGMIDLQERDRKLVESFLAKLPYPSGEAYGTPEHLMALFMANDPPVAIQLYTIEPAHNSQGAIKGRVNVVALTQNSGGQPGFISYTFQQTQGGWRMTSPNLPVGGIQAYLAKISTPEPAAN